MAGNGDERTMAAWERVEAKLDRLSERVGDLEDEVKAQGRVLKLVADRLLEKEHRTETKENNKTRKTKRNPKK